MSGPFGYDLEAAARAKQEPAALLGVVAPAEPDDEFDPAEHNIKIVLAYVEANPDDADRVLAAEMDGKGRRTIIDALS